MMLTCLLAGLMAITNADVWSRAHKASDGWLVLQQSATQQLKRVQQALLQCESTSESESSTRLDLPAPAFTEGPYLDWLQSVVRASGWLIEGEHSSSLLTLQQGVLDDAASDLARHLPREASVRLEKTLVDWLDAFDGRLLSSAQENATTTQATICDRLWPALGILLLASYSELLRSPAQLRHADRPPPSFCDNDGEPWEPDVYVVRPSERERVNRKLDEDTLRQLRLVLESYGFVVLQDVLPGDVANSLRTELLETRSTHLNATTLQPQGRAHPLLHPLEPKVESALRWMGVLKASITASHLVDGLDVDGKRQQLRGKGGVNSASSDEAAAAPGFFGQILPAAGAITELAALLVYPGASAQVPHTDTFNLGDHDVKVTTAFTVLQNTREEMGALQLVPRSHLCPLAEPVDEAEFAAKKVTLALPQGATVFMNSRTLHRSGRHTSDTDRVVFYFSWAEAARGSRKYLPVGSTYALRPDLWGSMSLPLSFEYSAGAYVGTDSSKQMYDAAGATAMLGTDTKNLSKGGLPLDQESSGGDEANDHREDTAIPRDKNPEHDEVMSSSCGSARPGTPSAWGLADLLMIRVREAALSTLLTRENADSAK